MQAVLQAASPGTLLTSSWALLEFTSALARLRRMQRFEGDSLAIQRALDEHARYLYTITDPTPADFLKARKLLLQDTGLGLRGDDALHLAISARLGETIYTLDRKLLDCAAALGIRATNTGIRHEAGS